MSIVTTRYSNDGKYIYKINFNKIKEGCKNLWFGSIDIESYGSSPREIIIDESEPYHFVQIMYLLKKCYLEENKWLVFTKKNIMDLIEKERETYLEDEIWFGKKFYEDFNSFVTFFLKLYCDKIGNY
jgi:hypothetical protein